MNKTKTLILIFIVCLLTTGCVTPGGGMALLGQMIRVPTYPNSIPGIVGGVIQQAAQQEAIKRQEMEKQQKEGLQSYQSRMEPASSDLNNADNIFKGSAINPADVASVHAMVSGNTFYLKYADGSLIDAVYHRNDGQAYVMFLPQSNLLRNQWSLNGSVLCYVHTNNLRECFKIRKDKEGIYYLDGDNRDQNILRIVKGDPYSLENRYMANADYYDSNARNNATDAALYGLIFKGLESNARDRDERLERLRRENPNEYRRITGYEPY